MKAIRNNRPGQYHAGGLISLLPGLNLLDTPEKIKAWEKAKENPGVLLRLEFSKRFPGGELQEIEVADKASTGKFTRTKKPAPVAPEPEEIDKEEESDEESDSIEGLTRKGCLDAVGACEDIPTLQEWAENQTKDPTVKKAIRERIEELEED